MVPTRVQATGSRGGRSRQASMSNFIEKIYFQATASVGTVREIVGVLHPVDYMTATNSVDAGKLIMTCIRLINEAQENDESNQFCAYLISIITAIFPGLETEAQSAIRELGAAPMTRVMPRDAAILAVELEDNADPNICLMMFFQTVLVLFKNVNIDHINSARAMMGVQPSVMELKAFDLPRAKTIQTRVGACISFRAAIVHAIIAASRSNSNLGRLCAYLSTILAWTDMSDLVFICDGLLATKSPVLEDHRVQNEVKALARAFNLINKTDYPQYFRITRPPMECKLLERNRFPILLSVATQIRRQDYPSVRQFVTTPQNDLVVRELLALHRARRHGINQATTT